MHEMERFLSLESPTGVGFCLRDACALGYRARKGLHQTSPRTAGDRRMVVIRQLIRLIRQFGAFLGGWTDLICASSVLELSVLRKLNFSQPITDYSAHLPAEMQTYRNAAYCAKR